MSEDENEERESDQIANTVRNHVQMLLEDGVRDAQTIQDTVLERTSIRVNLDRIQEAIDERAEHLDMPMPDTPCVMSEARFDLDYGPTLNDSPLELLDSQVSVLSLYHVWTQADDAEGHGWLFNGVYTSTIREHPGLRDTIANVVGYWLTARPWQGYPGDLRVEWHDEEDTDE
jgi:hypothetical protein